MMVMTTMMMALMSMRTVDCRLVCIKAYLVVVDDDDDDDTDDSDYYANHDVYQHLSSARSNDCGEVGGAKEGVL